MLTGVLFGSLTAMNIEWSWQYMLLISVAGCVFGWARYKTQSTAAAAFMHSTLQSHPIRRFPVRKPRTHMIETIQWTDAGVVMIDQTRLPREEVYVTCTDYQQVADAIRSMVIRGAPAIGVAAAMGIALGMQQRRVRRASSKRSAKPSAHPPHRRQSVLGHRTHAPRL